MPHPFWISFDMMFLPTFPLFIAVVAAASPPLIRRHAHQDVPHGWSIHHRAEPDYLLPLKFALVQSNLPNLDAYLLDVSDPQSVNYGKHWTTAKVAETFRPSPETVDTVRSWLVDSTGIEPHEITPSSNGALHLNVTVSEAERILGTKYYVYRHAEEGSERIGCHQGYSLPAHVSEHIDFVWPTVYFGSLSPRMAGNSPALKGRRSGSAYDQVTTGQAPRSVSVSTSSSSDVCYSC